MFKDAMEEYNGAQESFREKNKERIEKQLRYGKQVVILHALGLMASGS